MTKPAKGAGYRAVKYESGQPVANRCPTCGRASGGSVIRIPGRRMRFVPVHHVTHVLSIGKTLEIWTEAGMEGMLTTATLAVMLRDYPDEWVRASRRAIVRLSSVRAAEPRYEKNLCGATITMAGGHTVEVSRREWSALRKVMRKLLK